MTNDEEAEDLLRSENLGKGSDPLGGLPMLINAVSSPSVEEISRIWYDAAIFCLNRAEFMRVPHICTVQAVAILGMVFNIFGDADLGQHMRSSAIRIGRRLGLNTPCSDRAGTLSVEAQHRLWWTLIICEWYDVLLAPDSEPLLTR